MGDSAIGDALVNHDGVDAITFTGSHRGGAADRCRRGARGPRCEMGGKNAAVVLDDADFDLALEQVMLGRSGPPARNAPPLHV